MSITAATDGSCTIDVSQLCIGLHVHVDLPWTRHPFTFSSFKIRSLEQIAVLQSLGVQRIRYSPAKSDGDPLIAHDDHLGFDLPPEPPRHDDPALEAKRQRIARLAAQRQRVAACEREFLSSARAMKSINQNIFSLPEHARQEAVALSRSIADSMLMDVDIAINLMKDKLGAEETYHHALNVAVMSMMLAKELKAPPEAMRLLGVAAIFHDAGRMDLPERVTRKTDPLTKAEAALLQQHVPYGIEIGRKLGLPAEALHVIAQHHEHADGSGYPKGLKGNEISMLARIVAVVNEFDNLCNPVNAARALTPHEALSLLYGQQRAQFEPMVLNTFIRCMGIYPPGTVVVLSNDTLALVTSVNSTKPLKPTVLIYDPAVPRDEAILVDLEEEPGVTIVRTLKPQQLPDEVFDYLSPRRRMAYYFDSPQRAAA
jgi:putative nucleotidyltransferase with HDIG domain